MSGRASRRDLVFEIGCEELPVDYIEPARRQLEQRATAELAARRLEAGRVVAAATCRRLVLRVEGLADRQLPETREALGPKTDVAFGKDGTLTQAGAGFLRKLGLAPEAAQVKDGRLFVRIEDPGRPAEDLLPEVLLACLQSLTFPKSMRWEDSGARFARPVRWLMAWHGDRLIPVRFADVASGPATRRHPLLRPATVNPQGAEGYAAALAEGRVLLDAEARRARLSELLDREAERCGGRLVPDPELLEITAWMGEWPGVVSGRIPEAFMDIPRIVITTAMREHQRYFAVENRDGKLLPAFLAVTDNPLVDDTAAMRPGFEKVLVARLQDARFFYQEDLKRPLAGRVPDLERVLWIKGLGHLLDKTRRLEALAAWLAARLEPAALDAVRQAAHLSKTDLLTLMVQEKEFTSLQGVMGMYYARAQGLPEDVAQAIGEQYLPRGAGDALPQSPAGRILALADKLDHLAGCWGAGFQPTGNKDPFALRRAVQGLIAIVLEAGYRVSLPEALRAALQGFPSFMDRAGDLARDLQTFIQGRLEGELAQRGVAPDMIQAVLGVWWDDAGELVVRAETLQRLREETGFAEAVTTFSRVVNILPKTEPRILPPEAPEPPVEASRFEAPVEREMLAAAEAAGGDLERSLHDGDTAGAFHRLTELRPLIDRYFEDVLVMDPRPEIQRNRLHLLGRLARRIWRLADFSKLVVKT